MYEWFFEFCCVVFSDLYFVWWYYCVLVCVFCGWWCVDWFWLVIWFVVCVDCCCVDVVNCVCVFDCGWFLLLGCDFWWEEVGMDDGVV